MAEKDLRENPFRDEIYNYLIKDGYKPSKKSDYDVKNALDISALFEFLRNTQGEELEKFKHTYGSKYKEKYIELLNDKIEERGLLKALTEKMEDYASSTSFDIAYFRTNLEVMTDSMTLYEKNILSIRKELAFEDKENSFRVDLAIFLNGIPIIMIELKKQTSGQKASFNGTQQFKDTRNPEELIFKFNKRTLVYFTLDEFEAYITTRLDKKDTFFLPFNKGSENEGAGNPCTTGKHSTYYVWEEILEKDMIFKIIREFMFIDDRGNMIFPRYHQLDAVLKAEKDVEQTGIGGRYLIWHSAGSGKTKTIAWLSKRLINNSNINTVIVISDRTVIDSQLGTEIKTVDGEKGVAQWIDGTSKDLIDKLKKGGYIIITTLQKFPNILVELKNIPNRNYAIIIDEAHSSTGGKTISKTSETLSGKSLKESIETDKIYEEYEDDQNRILRQKSKIEALKNVSYFAFTATPKTQTMELFGTRCEAGKKYFHKYSMKQAIEEKFILNPLECYTIYDDKFEIRQKKEDHKEYDSSKTAAAILNYITSSEEVINTKTKIILDDFVHNRIKWLSGESKAMIIAPSRKHAVCYKLAVEDYIQKNNLTFKSIVAFTGTIEIHGEKYTEENMNKNFKETEIIKIIKNNIDARIIIVADKLQTGFDESRLCILYVDKKLSSDIKAVQTLSRINRPHKNKKTFVLDFVNDPEEIKTYFSKYLGGELFLPSENETDPNILFKKKNSLLDYCIFTLNDVNDGYKFITEDSNNSGNLTSLVAKVKMQYEELVEDKQKKFLAESKKFIKLFYYISTVYNNWDEEMKKLAVFLDALYNVLYQTQDKEKVNVEELVELIRFSTEKAIENKNILGEVIYTSLDEVSVESVVRESSYSYLEDIVNKINSKYNYEKAEEEINNIVSDLSYDQDMVSSVRDSSESAYESEIIQKVTEMFFDGILSDDIEKSQFCADISNDKEEIKRIAIAIINKIKNGLMSN